MKKLFQLAVAVMLPTLAACSQAVTPSPDVTTADGRTPLGPSGRWVLTWADEFNGTTVDVTKWRPNWAAWDDTSVTKPVDAAEVSCYDPRQVTEADGALHLAAVQRPCLSWKYASGLVRTQGRFQFTYGYAEARMLLPASSTSGACTDWPAFWLNAVAGAPVEEIDTMECLGGDVQWHYHGPVNAQDATNLTSAWRQSMPRTPGGWHTFGVDWEPGSMTFYYDGVPQGSAVRAATHPHYLVLNLALSSTMSPPVVVPQSVSVDYVRVFTRR